MRKGRQGKDRGVASRPAFGKIRDSRLGVSPLFMAGGEPHSSDVI